MQNPAKVRGIFSAIASRYDLANHLLSGGLDFLWRAKAVRLIAQRQPRRILDLATGSGDLGLALTKALPQAQVVGADFCSVLSWWPTGPGCLLPTITLMRSR